MNVFNYKVELVIEVEAFDDSDAWNLIQDNFGVGENMGVNVIECNYEEIVAKRK